MRRLLLSIVSPAEIAAVAVAALGIAALVLWRLGALPSRAHEPRPIDEFDDAYMALYSEALPRMTRQLRALHRELQRLERGEARRETD